MCRWKFTKDMCVDVKPIIKSDVTCFAKNDHYRLELTIEILQRFGIGSILGKAYIARI